MDSSIASVSTFKNELITIEGNDLPHKKTPLLPRADDSSSDISSNSNSTTEKHRKKNKIIFTPHWFTNAEFKQKNKKSWDEKYKEMTDVHYRMEVLEKKISDDEIPDVIHPGMLPSLEVKKEPLDITLKEKRLLKKYTLVQEKQIKPLFWPDRVYDDEMQILNESETNQLVQQIEKINEPVDIDDFDEPRIRKESAANQIEGRHCITFSTLDYETENESDNTQWSDAEY